MSNRKAIRELTADQITEAVISLGEKKFRAMQIVGWLSKGVESFDEMKNLPGGLREKLKEAFYVKNVAVIEELKSKDGTSKYLLSLRDGEVIEAVLMRYKHGNSICISTQVGCRMGCSFCASTLNGMSRNLTAGEMLGQLYAVGREAGLTINNVVLMGSGEPLDNYDEVVRFLRLVNSEDTLNISMRNMTLSTCGLVPGIYKLADEHLPITLAISLHTPYDEERDQLIPVNKRYPIEDLLNAVDYYIKNSNRRVTFEYAMINGVNDSIREAKMLGQLLKGKLCHVNLIPVNPVKEKNYNPSKDQALVAFKNLLEKYGVVTTIRRELGSDINAACGQLRNKHISENPNIFD